VKRRPGREPGGGDVPQARLGRGCMFAAAQAGHDQIVLRPPIALPDGPAEVIAEIDGHAYRWPVEITDRHLVREVVPIVLGPISAM
jgi:hypothetical protein